LEIHDRGTLLLFSDSLRRGILRTSGSRRRPERHSTDLP
jgi:hypothetical protein